MQEKPLLCFPSLLGSLQNRYRYQLNALLCSRPDTAAFLCFFTSCIASAHISQLLGFDLHLQPTAADMLPQARKPPWEPPTELMLEQCQGSEWLEVSSGEDVSSHLLCVSSKAWMNGPSPSPLLFRFGFFFVKYGQNLGVFRKISCPSSYPRLSTDASPTSLYQSLAVLLTACALKVERKQATSLKQI